MKIIKSLIFSVVAGLATAFFSAIILGVLNLYLAGHGNYILDEQYNYGLFSGGIGDMILIFFTTIVSIITFVIYYRQ